MAKSKKTVIMKKEPTFIELYKKAAQEDPSAKDVQALRHYYETNPPDTWNEGIAFSAVEEALDRFDNAALAEMTRAGMLKLCQELGYALSPPLEQLLIEHIALCWINMNTIQYTYDSVTKKSLTLNQGTYWEKRLSAAQRRYLRAIESLAKVRKMKLPAIQLNIGAQQMNIAQ